MFHGVPTVALALCIIFFVVGLGGAAAAVSWAVGARPWCIARTYHGIAPRWTEDREPRLDPRTMKKTVILVGAVVAASLVIGGMFGFVDFDAVLVAAAVVVVLMAGWVLWPVGSKRVSVNPAPPR